MIALENPKSSSLKIDVAHRRSKSIAIGNLTEQSFKEQDITVLQDAFKIQAQALQESQQEAKLAAEIGQSLLCKAQEMEVFHENNSSEVRIVYYNSILSKPITTRLSSLVDGNDA